MAATNTPADSATDNHLAIDSLSCLWTIPNLSKLPQQSGEYFESHSFSAGTTRISEWKFKFYPKGNSKDYEDLLILALEYNGNEALVFGRCLFSIIQLKEEKCKLDTFVHTLGFSTFIRRDSLFHARRGLLDNDKLTLRCQLSEVREVIAKVQIPKCKLTEDFGNLLQNAEFSDVKLITHDGGTFRAHKAILAARSEVFAAMFRHDMTESQLNCVEIIDLSAQVLKEMLHFIYTGQAPNLDAMSADLLAAADKYNLERLKVMCIGELFDKLCIEKAAQTLMIADLYCLDELRTFTLDFIKKHTIEVKKTQEWLDMIKNHGDLTVKLIGGLVLTE